jgi:hypothetical protein
MTSVNRPIEEMLDTECPKDIRKPRRNDSMAKVVADYIDHRRDKARAEREKFARPLTLSEAARLAGLAQTKGGKSFSHPRRVPKAALRRSARRLQAAVSALSACRDFDALHALIQAKVGGLRGIGALTVYDTANRLGGNLGLEPKRVYLHAGTLGAQALGIRTDQPVADMSAFPTEVRRLRPREVEDALCIFKDRLRHIIARRRRAAE